MSTADVVIVGGGLIGCATARALALNGAQVVVVERGTPGMASTWAAAGMLSPAPDALHPIALQPLAAASFERYAQFTDVLAEESGTDVGYETEGRLHVALDEPAAAELPDRARGSAQYGARLLDTVDVLDLEPALSPRVRAAVLINDDHHVDNRRLGAAAWSAAVKAGVDFHTEQPVQGIESDGARCTGVRLASGAWLRAGTVVIAAGAWSGLLEGLPRSLPVRPARGQMLALRTGDLLRRVVTSRDVYLVPRRSGELLIGATIEQVGFQTGPTPRGLRALMEAGMALVPGTADLEVSSIWSGFRPVTPDELPILGADPTMDGLLYATGHFRHGILLAPITAEIIASLLTGGTPPVAINDFSIDRFDDVADPADASPAAASQQPPTAAPRRVVDRADFDPAYDPDAPVLCERCGDVMVYTRSCRIVCRNCGMTRDCADP